MLQPPSDQPSQRLKWFLAVFAAVAIGVSAHVQFSDPVWPTEWPKKWDEDIKYIWYDGWKIAHGQNPYARLDAGSMKHNDKYATYLPLFYLLTAATYFPLPWFSSWLLAWRIVFFVAYAGIGVTLLMALYRRGLVLAAVFAFTFWIFNRWCLSVLGIAHTDFLPVGLLLGAILLLPTHRRTALLLLGVSLAIKHLAVVLLPLYAIWLWQDTPPDRRRRVLIESALLIAAVPLAVSLPFLIIGPRSFVRSILFSATRVGDGHFGAPSIDHWVWLIGLPGKTMMLFVLVTLFIAVAYRRVPRYTGIFLVLLVFTDMNSVAFRQYMVWPLPFALLMPLDWVSAASAKANPIGYPPAAAT